MKKMIRAIIVDDEKRVRETINNILHLYCSSVEVVAEADDLETAIEVISKHKPDIVFLDITMPGGNGFDLLTKLGKIDFKLVFITAFEEYAIKAFKFSALDYLLKPVNPDEIIAVIEKAESQIEKENTGLKFESLITNLQNITREVKKIVLKTSDSIFVINVADIIRCEADSNYTSFLLNNGKRILVSTTLKEYDDMLSSYRFFRAHQSHLVNIDYIESYEKKDGGYLIMKDKSHVPVSVRKKETLLNFLEKS